MDLNQPIFVLSLLQPLLFAAVKIDSTRLITMIMLLTTVISTRTIHRIPNRYMLVKDSTSVIRLTSNRHVSDLEAVKHKFSIGPRRTWKNVRLASYGVFSQTSISQGHVDETTISHWCQQRIIFYTFLLWFMLMSNSSNVFFQLSCLFPCFDYFLWFDVFFQLDRANDCILLFIDSLVDESDFFKIKP